MQDDMKPRSGRAMDDEDMRILALQKWVVGLRTDLDKLTSRHFERCARCRKVASIVCDLAGWEQETHEFVREVIRKAFPRHDYYLDEIDRVLKRARKRKD